MYPVCARALSNFLVTLGTKDFYSRVTRSFVGRGPTRLLPPAEDKIAHEKSLAPRILFGRKTLQSNLP